VSSGDPVEQARPPTARRQANARRSHRWYRRLGRGPGGSPSSWRTSPPGQLAFLFVSTSSRHKSQLSEILSRTRRLPVRERRRRRGGGRHVYLIRHHQHRLSGTSLALTRARPARAEHARRPSVPPRWRPPRREGQSAVNPVGAAPTGRWLPDHKAEGGITFAQDERSAKQSSMPRSAVADGNVDHVLSPRDIARHSCGSTATPTPGRTPKDRAEPCGSRQRHQGGPRLCGPRTSVDCQPYKQTRSSGASRGHGAARPDRRVGFRKARPVLGGLPV